MDCTLQSLHHLTGYSIDSLVEQFKWGTQRLEDGTIKPPGVHQIIDFCMAEGIALTPVMKDSVSTHGRLIVRDYTRDEETRRWETYISLYEGLLVGTRNGIGHMAFNKLGVIYDGKLQYALCDASKYQFEPTTFLVATWQA